MVKVDLLIFATDSTKDKYGISINYLYIYTHTYATT